METVKTFLHPMSSLGTQEQFYGHWDEVKFQSWPHYSLIYGPGPKYTQPGNVQQLSKTEFLPKVQLLLIRPSVFQLGAVLHHVFDLPLQLQKVPLRKCLVPVNLINIDQ